MPGRRLIAGHDCGVQPVGLHRPALVTVPALGPRLLLGGEGAAELAQASQNVRPQRLIEAGHQFLHPTLDQALRHLLSREPAVPPGTAEGTSAPPARAGDPQ